MLPTPDGPLVPSRLRAAVRRTHRLALAALAALVLVAGLAPVPAEAAPRDRIEQESWLEWQVADALTAVRQSPRSVDGHATEPAARPLTGWTDLRDFAREWSDTMASRRAMSHNPAFADGYCCWEKAGEVLAELTVGPHLSEADLTSVADRAVRSWMASSGHRRQILDGAYDHVGVGVTIDHDRGVVWVAVDLRQTASGATPPGGAWYRPGTEGPPMPAPGTPCSGTRPYAAEDWPRPASTMTRRGGTDRVATALAVSRGVAAPDTVLLASAAAPSDALSAAGLAGATDAPVLLTGPTALDDRVAHRLAQWDPSTVVLLGGGSALEDRVAAQVRDAVPSARVDRVRGGDRFATAASVADRLVAEGGDSRRVMLALGSHPQPSRSWADAVTVSGFAASHDHPVLLTAPDELPASTRAALRGLSPDHVVVPGGTSGVSDHVLSQVRRAVPTARVERVAGPDRYATSRAVVALDQGLRGEPTRRVHVVHGGDWPDALTAGPAAAASGAVVALVDGRRPDGGGRGIDHLRDLASQLDRLDLTLVGGPAAISGARTDAIRAALPCVE